MPTPIEQASADPVSHCQQRVDARCAHAYSIRSRFPQLPQQSTITTVFMYSILFFLETEVRPSAELFKTIL